MIDFTATLTCSHCGVVSTIRGRTVEELARNLSIFARTLGWQEKVSITGQPSVSLQDGTHRCPDCVQAPVVAKPLPASIPPGTRWYFDNNAQQWKKNK